MNRLEELLILILDRAHKEGKANLSRFEILKIVYLLQVYALKYAGTNLLQNTTFIREKNGPISVEIYKTMDNLVARGYIKMDVKENKDYGHPRHCFTLIKKLPRLSFGQGELIFIDGFLSELLLLNQAQLKSKAYATEPMKAITSEEKRGKIKKGQVINFASVSVDADVVDAYSDAI